MNDARPGSLADVAFETGVIAERERIIKLLVDENQCPENGACTDNNCRVVYAVIRLIKGENK